MRLYEITQVIDILTSGFILLLKSTFIGTFVSTKLWSRNSGKLLNEHISRNRMFFDNLANTNVYLQC